MSNSQTATSPIGGLRAGVGSMMTLDPGELSDGELASTILGFRHELDRLDSVFADLVLAGHRRGVGREDGYESTPSWLRARSGMRTGEVHAAIGAGELGEVLPATRTAWRDGRISSGAVRIMRSARVAGYDDELAAVEPELLAAARRKDHWSLGRMAQHFKRCARRDGGLPPERDGLRASIVGGRLAVDGDIGGLNAETIYGALDAFTDRPSEGDDRTPAQRKADGLARLCRVAMGAEKDAVMASPSATVVIDWATFLTHLNREAFVRFGQMDGAFIGALDPSEVETMLCDCTISRMILGSDSQPVNLGTETRTYPRWLRRRIAARDRHCKWPGCEIPPGWCETHHVKYWQHGGETSYANGVLLCSRHHHFLHAHPTWQVVWDQTTFRVYRDDGTEVCPTLEHTTLDLDPPDGEPPDFGLHLAGP